MSILVVTNKTDTPSDEVINHLVKMKENVFRLNTEDICQSVDFELGIDQDQFIGSFVTNIRSIDFKDIKSVFYRRPELPELPGLNEIHRNFIRGEIAAFINWLWVALRGRFWMNRPNQLRIADSKIDQLYVAPSFGFEIPRTIITNKEEKVREFYKQCEGRMINKVLSNGLVMKENVPYHVYTNRVTESILNKLGAVSMVPCLFQERIEKKFELRITVVGRKIYASEIHSQLSPRTKDDWRRYDLDNTPHKIHTLPKRVEKSCLKLMDYYNLAYGAIDMIVTPDDRYVFLEINPNGQWLWIEYLTKMPISKEIATILAKSDF